MYIIYTYVCVCETISQAHRATRQWSFGVVVSRESVRPGFGFVQWTNITIHLLRFWGGRGMYRSQPAPPKARRCAEGCFGHFFGAHLRSTMSKYTRRYHKLPRVNWKTLHQKSIDLQRKTKSFRLPEESAVNGLDFLLHKLLQSNIPATFQSHTHHTHSHLSWTWHYSVLCHVVPIFNDQAGVIGTPLYR